MFRTTKNSIFNHDSYFAWIAQQRRSIYPGDAAADVMAGRGFGNSPALEYQQRPSSGTVAGHPSVQRGPPRTYRARGGRGRGGRGRGDAGGMGPGGLRALNPTPPQNLTASNTERLPSAAGLSNEPNLIGKDGQELPLDHSWRSSVQMATPPQAVQPRSVGLGAPQNRPQSTAISNQHAPDQSTASAGVERAKQLPSTQAYQQAEGAAHMASEGMRGAGGGAGGSSLAARRGVKRRSLFTD